MKAEHLAAMRGHLARQDAIAAHQTAHPEWWADSTELGTPERTPRPEADAAWTAICLSDLFDPTDIIRSIVADIDGGRT